MASSKLVQIQPITAWSYSRFGDYEKCPALAKFKVIDKLREPSSPALDKGNLVHSVAAAYVTGKAPVKDKDNFSYHGRLVEVAKTPAVPPELVNFTDRFKALRKAGGCMVEQDWAFTEAWERTGWFDKAAWVRIKVDNHYLEVKKKRGGLRETTVEIIDYKTGKWSDAHALQRSLYALGALLIYPDAVSVKVAHWYLDTGKDEYDLFGPGNLEKLKKEWVKRTTAMLHDTTFAPTSGQHCKWCFFRKANNGPCQF